MPGGEIVIGSPEDVMLSGAVAQAFEGRQVRFDVEERSFRWLTGDRGTAQVVGSGPRAAMARAVVEREGYAVAGVSGSPEVRVEIDEPGWRAAAGGRESRGRDFASLAAFLRERGAEA